MTALQPRKGKPFFRSGRSNSQRRRQVLDQPDPINQRRTSPRLRVSGDGWVKQKYDNKKEGQESPLHLIKWRSWQGRAKFALKSGKLWRWKVHWFLCCREGAEANKLRHKKYPLNISKFNELKMMMREPENPGTMPRSTGPISPRSYRQEL